MARAHGPRHRTGDAFARLDREAPGRAGRPRRPRLSLERGRERDHVPDPDDLRLDPDAERRSGYRPGVGAQGPVHRYDPRQTRAADKTGVTVGMAMTEKQG